MMALDFFSPSIPPRGVLLVKTHLFPPQVSSHLSDFPSSFFLKPGLSSTHPPSSSAAFFAGDVVERSATAGRPPMAPPFSFWKGFSSRKVRA